MGEQKLDSFTTFSFLTRLDNIRMLPKLLLQSFVFLIPLISVNAQAQSLVREFPVEEAKQAVAVDAAHFYVINNSTSNTVTISEIE